MSNLNKKREENNRAQDYVTNKLLSAFTIAFIMIIAIMNVSRMMRRTDTFVATFKAMGVLAWVLLALTVIFAVAAIVIKTKGKEEPYRLVSAKHVAVILGFITLCFGALALAFNSNTINFLYVFIPAVTVLFIIYHTYPRDFFALATVSGFGAIGLWLTGTAISGGMGASKLWLIIGLMLAGLAIATVLTILVQANGGSLFRKGKGKIFGGEANYVLLYVTYALILALTVATWALAGAMMYYFVFALLAYLVFVGIYYTMKML